MSEPDTSADLKAIFCEALEQPAGDRRAAFLDRACAGDPAARDQVEALLRAHGQAGSFLESPAPPPTLAGAPAPGGEAVGTAIGPYKLLQQIGAGGMGVVFMAEQQRPVKRRVALKLIKAGMDTAQVVARFEAERQALALMDHPNIARVLDAGATDSGRPYFVMELVNGVPITDYCDGARLSYRERLGLFVPVCQAIQHAHQKGVIHRDIKPSNVLVTLVDGRAVPKVIDFGVAKAIEQRLTERSLFTHFGALVGTPEYMSPEQASLSAVDVDTRSDVYVLGVLLYELLTGTTPLGRATLREAAYAEVLRRVREEEPPRPSARLSASGERLAAIAAVRQSDPRRLPGLVRGELDWVVMKALEKDRSQRYQSASDFAADIRRHLADLPVEAGPPSTRYRFAKYARRHRAALMTAALLVLALALGTAVSTWQAIRATRAGELARQRGALAAERERKANLADGETRAVMVFLVQDLLDAAVPKGVGDRELTVAEALANADSRIGTAFVGSPLLEARMRRAMALTFYRLGRYDDARRHASRAYELNLRHLGPEHVDTVESMSGLANALSSQGRWDEAGDLLEQALELYRLHIEPVNHNEPLPSTTWLMNNLAVTLQHRGRWDEARALAKQTLEIRRRLLGPEHPDTVPSMVNLASMLSSQGQWEEAGDLLEQALEIQGQILPEHSNTLRVMNKLSQTLHRRGRWDEARALAEQALTIQRRTLGPEHPDTLSSMDSLANVLSSRGRWDEARALAEQALTIQRRTLGPERPDTLDSMNRFVETIASSADAPDDDRARALELARQAIELEPDNRFYRNLLGVAEYHSGHWDAAIRAAAKAIDEEAVAPTAWVVLAAAHARRGEPEEARRWYDMAWPVIEAGELPPHLPDWLVAEAASLLGEAPPPGDAAPETAPDPTPAPVE